MMNEGGSGNYPDLHAPLTRRKFLEKIGKTGAKLAAVELTIGPFQRAIALANDLVNAFGEGNPIQRAATLDRMLSAVAFHPHEPRYSEAVYSWMKFNAAEAYGRTIEEYLASDMVRHFLYGNKETFDPIDQVKQSWLRFYHKVPPRDLDNFENPLPVPRTPDEAMKLYLERTFSDAFYYNYAFFNRSPRLKITNNMPLLTAQLNSEDSISKFNPEIARALNYYEGNLEGHFQLRGPFPTTDTYLPPYYVAEFDSPVFILRDQYDWEHHSLKTQGQRTGIVAVDFLNSIGATKLQKDMTLGILNTFGVANDELTLGHNDASLLADLGFAHEYAVEGKYQVQGPFSIRIKDNLVPPQFLKN